MVGASGRGGLQRSGKERICKGKPGDPVSVSEGRQSVSFPPAQKRTSARINEPDILIRRGKCSRELEEPHSFFFFFIGVAVDDRVFLHGVNSFLLLFLICRTLTLVTLAFVDC